MCEVTHHTGHAPDVSRRTIPTSKENLKRSVLPRLNILCEMLVLERERERV